MIFTDAQISFDDPAVGLDRLRDTLGDLAAEIDDIDIVGNIHDQIHVVFDQEHGKAVFFTDLLDKIRLVDIPFSKELPITPLHWMIGDQSGSIVVESVRDGLHIYDNPVGVMTNNPTFDKQLFRLNDYRSVSAGPSENTFAKGLDLDPYSRGMGGIGLPGDLSSGSRFVKVAFTKMNSVSNDDEDSSVSQFFHILGSVEQQRGCCDLGDGKYEITIYSSCCNMDRGIYYYRTYDNSQISAVDMHHEDLDGRELVSYPLVTKQQINQIN